MWPGQITPKNSIKITLKKIDLRSMETSTWCKETLGWAAYWSQDGSSLTKVTHSRES